MTGYKQIMTMKITRTEHNVSFGRRLTARTIKGFLGQVPDEALLIDYDIGDDGEILLIFEQEKSDGE